MPEKEKVMEEFESLNPQAVVVGIGVRSLRNITIYPLSLADQLKMTDLIAKALEGVVERESLGEVAMVSFVLEVIKENVGKILSMATDEKEEDLLAELTNPQLVVIVEHIFDMNYASIAKNVKSLAEKAKSLFPSARQSQQSSNDIQATG